MRKATGSRKRLCTLHDSHVEPSKREHHNKKGREAQADDDEDRKADGHGAAQPLDDTG